MVVIAVDDRSDIMTMAVIMIMIISRTSLEQAERTLAYLRMSSVLGTFPVILVANKTDLVRSRQVKTCMGKEMAIKYGIKYIETAPGM